MSGLFEIFLRSVFVENLALSFLLGMCPFLAVSTVFGSALGVGLALTALCTVSVLLCSFIFYFFVIGKRFLVFVCLIFINCIVLC